MKTLVVALALASQLLASPAIAQEAALMTLAEFRLHNETARGYMVLGAIALTGKLTVACPRPVAVGEWNAGLMFVPGDVQRPWIDVLIELMDERGCKGVVEKGDT